MNKNNGQTSLLLYNGFGYTYSKDHLQQAEYRIMHRLFFFFYVSLIPILALYLVSAFAMINPRYQENHTFTIIFGTTLLLYLTASSLEKWGTPLLLIAAIIMTISAGYILFQKQVARYF